MTVSQQGIVLFRTGSDPLTPRHYFPLRYLVLKSSIGVNPTFAGAPISKRRCHFQSPSFPAFSRGTLAAVRCKRFVVSAVDKNDGEAPFSPDDPLEKMMEDPKFQQMVDRYLPEESGYSETDAAVSSVPNNRGEISKWDKQMMDSLKNFDLNNSEVKQQFEKIGVDPQELISKIMANPDLTAAFRNLKIQAAIMDCSENPRNISKYRNDKEIMDVFPKLAALFPGVTG